MKVYFICILSVFFIWSTEFSSYTENIKYHSFYILKHQWHTGIIINTNDVQDELSFLLKDFNGADYIEIGWGDKDFYMAENETVWLALKAALWPTKSVLHIAEINNHMLLSFDEKEIIKLKLGEQDFNTLTSYIKESFYLSEDQEIVKLGSGLYGKSYFYLSNEKYHLFKTCNVWLAKGLKKADVSIKPFYAITSKNVLRQLKKGELSSQKQTIQKDKNN